MKTCPQCRKPTLDYDQERKLWWCRNILECDYRAWEIEPR